MTLIVPGVQWQQGLTSTLTIPAWKWRQVQGQEVRKRKAPKPEFEADRLYQRLSIMCGRDKLDGAKVFDDLITPMYLAMRQDLHEAQEKVRIAHDQILGLAAAMTECRVNSAPPIIEDAVLAIADGFVQPLPPPPEYIPAKPKFHECADGIFLSKDWAAGFCACCKRIPDHAGYPTESSSEPFDD